VGAALVAGQAESARKSRHEENREGDMASHASPWAFGKSAK
jgi:hypothetical protein